MSWCPNCKMEYREGVTHCTDCKVELVSNLSESSKLVELLATEEKEAAEKFTNFLKYSNIETASLTYDEEKKVFVVSVDEDSLKEAKKLYLGFYMEEKSIKANESEETTKPKISATFVKKQDQYKELSSTAYTFLLFGIFGIVFVILNYLDIINYLNGTFSFITMTGIFIGLLFVSITTFKKANKTKNEISEENQLIDTLNNWLTQNITKELLITLEDNTLSDEINFFNKTEQIKHMLEENFGQLDDSLIDHMVEEFYYTIEESDRR
jgi:uncharacterized membrane-anchored protein YhcB (DUF1043 family)